MYVYLYFFWVIIARNLWMMDQIYAKGVKVRFAMHPDL